MRKVVTVTFQSVLNFGGVLQAYALNKYLRNSGYSTKTLHYMPLYFLIQKYRPAKGLMKTIMKYRRIIKFNKFSKDHLPKTSGIVIRKSRIIKIDADSVVCGSDQIWNKHLTGGNYDPVFFLSPFSGSLNRISYAASSGYCDMTKDSQYLLPMLNGIDKISVREKQLKVDLEHIGLQKEIEVVLDPSLLLDDYSDVACFSKVPNFEFILTYIVGSGKTLSDFEAYVRKLKDRYNLPIVHIGAKRIGAADYNILDIGPSDWVGFFSKAKYVVTSSFHGAAFSINFEKQFLYFPHVDEERNYRAKTLFDLAGIDTPKIISSSSSACFVSIDYAQVKRDLEPHIESSKRFLHEALAGELE